MSGLRPTRAARVLVDTLPRVVLATSEPAPALAMHPVRLAHDHEVLVVSRVRIDVAHTGWHVVTRALCTRCGLRGLYRVELPDYEPCVDREAVDAAEVEALDRAQRWGREHACRLGTTREHRERARAS